MRNTSVEDVAQHTMQVAMIAHALCVIENTLYGGKLDANKAAVLALYHESAEVVTGDLPTPVKYYDDDINRAYKNKEFEKAYEATAESLKSVPEKSVAYFLDTFIPAYSMSLDSLLD